MAKLETNRSDELFEKAQEVIPGGVNSPVRAFRAVGRAPLFIQSAAGSNIADVDGNTYTDYVGSWGPMILGHAHPAVIEAVRDAASRGTSYGAPTEVEIELAREIIAAVPSIEKVRLVSSGTEATMSAIRLARGFTGRDVIVKFEGCYHGHTDSLLVKAGSGLATFGTPDSAGIPADFARNTIVAPFNDAAALERLFEEKAGRIAAVIIEPVAGNMGCVPPQTGYLDAVRDISARHGALLIFDEVMTGFRVAYGGAQELYNITPDLTCLGKIIGGGLPAAAFGGRADVMDRVAPVGPVYQAGTLSGNPLAVAAGLATLKLLREFNPYEELEARGARLEQGLRDAAGELGIHATVNRVGSMLTAFFTEGPVTGWDSARRSDTELYGRFFRAMLEEGIYLAPSQYECAFVSLAHTNEVIDNTIKAARASMQRLVE
ncbi:MAG TPA: glutamate-1-semialdehyde 2,1-aminomutase [Blastocatellia bacterium]|jgi:glutamate-1-semialdehyde 2,1-aminomutase|nr:glutamate-1-semialdehyde 2,1-aminomutase [Blastocatellia bacterium]